MRTFTFRKRADISTSGTALIKAAATLQVQQAFSNKIITLASLMDTTKLDGVPRTAAASTLKNATCVPRNNLSLEDTRPNTELLHSTQRKMGQLHPKPWAELSTHCRSWGNPTTGKSSAMLAGWILTACKEMQQLFIHGKFF